MSFSVQLFEKIKENASPKEISWVEARSNISLQSLQIAFVATPRFISKTSILSTSVINDISISGWPLDRLVRVYLLTTLDSSDKAIYTKTLDTPKLHKTIKRLLNLINTFEEEEDAILPEIDNNLKTNWNIYTSYIDITCMWAQGMNVIDTIKMLNEMNEYEGNFTRNMLKIYKLCCDIKCLINIAGKINLLPVLENMEKMILRDIVNIDSIYLNN
jgi:hypothetical protein